MCGERERERERGGERGGEEEGGRKRGLGGGTEEQKRRGKEGEGEGRGGGRGGEGERDHAWASESKVGFFFSNWLTQLWGPGKSKMGKASRLGDLGRVDVAVSSVKRSEGRNSSSQDLRLSLDS